MSFLFGESGRDREIRAREEMVRAKTTERDRERVREKAREEESDGRWHGKSIQDPLAPSENTH